MIVTSGFRSGALSSLYPRGIPIGSVTSVGQSDTDLYKQIQVDSFVDFPQLEAVIVLVKRPEAEIVVLDWGKSAALVFVAAILQVSVFSTVTILNGTPDLLLVVIICIALLRGSIAGADRLLGWPARRHRQPRDARRHLAPADASRGTGSAATARRPVATARTRPSSRWR